MRKVMTGWRAVGAVAVAMAFVMLTPEMASANWTVWEYSWGAGQAWGGAGGGANDKWFGAAAYDGIADDLGVVVQFAYTGSGSPSDPWVTIARSGGIGEWKSAHKYTGTYNVYARVCRTDPTFGGVWGCGDARVITDDGT